MPDYRHDPRVEEDADVIVKIQSSPGLHELEGRVFPCHSTDVSTGGMQLSLETDAPVGSLLELEICFNQTQNKFRHTGNVVWNKGFGRDDDVLNRHLRLIGIKFNTDNNPQYQSWATQVSNLLALNTAD